MSDLIKVPTIRRATNLRKETDKAYIKMVTRQVDKLQSVYGYPSAPGLCAETDFINKDLKNIWENAFILFCKETAGCEKYDEGYFSSKKKFVRTPRIKTIPLLYCPSSNPRKKKLFVVVENSCKEKDKCTFNENKNSS